MCLVFLCLRAPKLIWSTRPHTLLFFTCGSIPCLQPALRSWFLSLPASHLMRSTGNVQPYGPYRQPRTCQHHGWCFDAFTRKAGVDHHLVRSTIRSRRKGHQAAKFQSTLARPKIHSVKKLFSPGLGHNTYLNSRPVLQF